MRVRNFKEVVEIEGCSKWSIVNYSADTAHGFKHVSTLLFNNYEVCNEKCCYLNRTWECYTYQTSMRAVVSKYLKQKRDNIIYYYKQDNNIARLTKKHKEAIEKLEAEDVTISQLKEIYKQLENEA